MRLQSQTFSFNSHLEALSTILWSTMENEICGEFGGDLKKFQEWISNQQQLPQNFSECDLINEFLT